MHLRADYVIVSRISADLISACRRYKNVAKAWLEFETFKTRIGKADAGFFMPAVNRRFIPTCPAA
jgi:hypothetical protein